MPPFIEKILSVFIYREEASNDHLEAYPERLHVGALPERRYLKTSRFFVIAALLSVLFNFAMCFIYIRNASQVDAIVQVPARQDTFLYYLDYYNKELKSVEKPYRTLELIDLVFQNLIADYLNERFQITSNISQMQARWGSSGKVAAYAPKLYESFLSDVRLFSQRFSRGLTQEIYIYSIRNIDGNNFYEVIFDVFVLDENGYNDEKCPCRDKTEECLQCMRQTALSVQRNKAYMRVTLNIQETPKEEITQNINPYYFTVLNYYQLPQTIHLENEWEDVDTILE